MVQRIRDIYEYRDMIYSLVKRELRGRYQKSVLGMLWTFLNPFFQIVIYTLVFTVIFPNSIKNYSVYLTVGIIPWTFFQEALGQGAGIIVSNADMTKKIYFPREILTISTVTAKFINMLLASVVVLVFLLLSGAGISWHILLTPLVMLAQYLIALGFTLLISAVTVYLRDVEYITNVLLMAWIWATPIMYELSSIPVRVAHLLLFNPMTLAVEAYHALLYYHRLPSALTWGGMYAAGVILLVIGEIVFARLEGNFAEEL